MIRLPVEHSIGLDHILVDIVAAIELVALGGATRVVLVGLPNPEAVAADALAHAQRAGVRFALAPHEGGGTSVVIGPVEA